MNIHTRYRQLEDIVIIFTWVCTIFSLIIFIATTFLMYVAPGFIDGHLLSQKYFDLRFILLFLLIINSIGYVCAFVSSLRFPSMIQVLSPISLLFKVPLSILFGYFIWISFSFFNMMGYLGLLLLIALLFLLLVSFNSYYIHSYHTFSDFVAWALSIGLTQSMKTIRAARGQMRQLLMMTLLLFICSSVIFVINYKNDKFEKWLRNQFYIVSVIPSNTMHAELVTITGYNFGWPRSDQRWRLRSTSGDLIPQVWTDTEITFVVPLHLKEGQQYIWIQRPAKKDPLASESEESNHVPINVLSRFVYYPESGDSILQKIWKRVQLKTHEAYSLIKL